MDTKKYEVFEKTVELSSLTKAAEELGLTQSGVSHIIAALEEEFGFPLLTRSRTGARLTPEGEKIMPFLRDILRSQEQLDQTAAELRGLGFSMTDSRANFLFAAHPALTARGYYEALKARGVLIRCWDDPALREHVRITIGTPEENTRLLEVMAQL